MSEGGGRGCEDAIYQAGALMLEHCAGCCRRPLGLVAGEQRQTCGGFADPVGFVVGVDLFDMDCIRVPEGGDDEGCHSWWLDHLASDVLGKDEGRSTVGRMKVVKFKVRRGDMMQDRWVLTRMERGRADHPGVCREEL